VSGSRRCTQYAYVHCFTGAGTIDASTLCHDGTYPNIEISMSTRKLVALSFIAAIALSSTALAQGGGGSGGGGGAGGGAGGASGGAAGGATGTSGAAGMTSGTNSTSPGTAGAPNAGTMGSGANSNMGQRPNGAAGSDTINNQNRNRSR
jgi:hypothetical protein